ncbi:hypothetical protein HMPREF0290_1001 [Corynebacterium efficiens YS-314]|nr:hypothetical protein HMPREF0290_1001 [Corynebacterium efficiens YS-314]
MPSTARATTTDFQKVVSRGFGLSGATMSLSVVVPGEGSVAIVMGATVVEELVVSSLMLMVMIVP